MTEQPMKEQHADQGFRNLPKTLAPMTWRERFDHLWEYYRFTALVVVSAIVLSISLVVSIVHNLRQEVLFAGVTVNVTVSDEGLAQLNGDLFDLFEGEDEKYQIVELQTGTGYVEGDPNMNQVYAELMRVVSQIAAGDMDYLLLDQDGLEYFLGAQAADDLRNLVSEEYFETLEDRIVMGDLEDVGEAPLAIFIGDTEFAGSCARKGDGLYLIFPGNTQRNARVEAFIRYILGE